MVDFLRNFLLRNSEILSDGRFSPEVTLPSLGEGKNVPKFTLLLKDGFMTVIFKSLTTF